MYNNLQLYYFADTNIKQIQSRFKIATMFQVIKINMDIFVSNILEY